MTIIKPHQLSFPRYLTVTEKLAVPERANKFPFSNIFHVHNSVNDLPKENSFFKLTNRVIFIIRQINHSVMELFMMFATTLITTSKPQPIQTTRSDRRVKFD